MLQPSPLRDVLAHYPSSVSTTSTLDFDAIVEEAKQHPSLLEGELGPDPLISLPSFSPELIPPPLPRGIPYHLSFLDLHSNLPLCLSKTAASPYSAESECFNVLISGVTSPRLDKVPWKPVDVQGWNTNISPSDTPGHSPWADCDKSHEPWKPAGSMYSTEALLAKLANARSAAQVYPTWDSYRSSLRPPASPNPRSPSELPTSTSKAHRNALVFEQEVTVETRGSQRRLSLRAPAKLMNEEMVDIMLELQDLNSYFKDGLEANAPSKGEGTSVTPPTIMVSNSQWALPLSLDSSSEFCSGSAVPLATRRGKKMLSPIVCPTTINASPYPDIPTAFLGSPSTYSPKFEFSTPLSESALKLDNMIGSLRSQCASLPCLPSTPEIGYETTATCETSPTRSEESDEWAFATTLLEKYPAEPLILQRWDIPVNHPPVTTQQVSLEGDTLAENSVTLTAHSPQQGKSNTPNTPTESKIRPPATPAASTGREGATPKEVRGILKSSKSVRFATVPDLPELDPISTPPAPSVKVTSPKAPSSLRNTFGYATPLRLLPANGSSPRRGVDAALRPASIQVKKIIQHSFPTGSDKKALAQRQTLPLKDLKSNNKNDSPSGIPSATQSRRTTLTGGLNASNAKNSPLGTRSLGRKSIGSGIGKAISIGTGKENKSRSSISTSTPTRWTVNENSLRRSSIEIPERVTKSRMPVPLRNVLARFK